MTSPHATLAVAPPRRYRVAAAVAALLGVVTIVASARALVACARRVDTHFPDEL